MTIRTTHKSKYEQEDREVNKSLIKIQKYVSCNLTLLRISTCDLEVKLEIFLTRFSSGSVLTFEPRWTCRSWKTIQALWTNVTFVASQAFKTLLSRLTGCTFGSSYTDLSYREHSTSIESAL